jgi:hypothetical protein
MSLAALAAVAVGVYALWTYRGLALARGRERTVLLGLRIGLLVLAVFALMQPMLLLKVAVPQQNYVGILLDDSSSMGVADHDGGPRSSFILDQLGRQDGPLLTSLGERFSVRIFRFSSVAERLRASGDLTFQGTGTRLGDALSRVRDELSGLPVAGLVMVSDGADNAQAPIDDALAGLRAQAMPVFTVGVGRERLTRDVQVSRVELPRRVLKGTSLVVDVIVTQTGYAGQKVPLTVEDAGIVVSTQEITLPPDGESETVRVRFKAGEIGPRVFTFRVPGQAAEEVVENNRREMLTEVYDDRQKVLYIEGEPRFEPKYIRQAIAGDDNLQVVLLQRTAESTVDQPDSSCGSASTGRTSWSTGSRRRARSCSRIDRSFWAASKRRRCGPTSSGCSRTSWTSAAAACWRSAAAGRSAKADGAARRCRTRCRSRSIAACARHRARWNW